MIGQKTTLAARIIDFLISASCQLLLVKPFSASTPAQLEGDIGIDLAQTSSPKGDTRSSALAAACPVTITVAPGCSANSAATAKEL